MGCRLCLIASLAVVNQVLQAKACGDNIYCPKSCHIVCQVQVANTGDGSAVEFAQQQAKSCEGSGNGGPIGDAQTVCCAADSGEVCCASAAVNAETAVESSRCPLGKMLLTNMTRPTNSLRGSNVNFQSNHSEKFHHYPFKMLTNPKTLNMSATFGLQKISFKALEVTLKRGDLPNPWYSLSVLFPSKNQPQPNCRKLAASLDLAIGTLPSEPLGYAYWCFRDCGVAGLTDPSLAHVKIDVVPDNRTGTGFEMCTDSGTVSRQIDCLIVKIKDITRFHHDEVAEILREHGYRFAKMNGLKYWGKMAVGVGGFFVLIVSLILCSYCIVNRKTRQWLGPID